MHAWKQGASEDDENLWSTGVEHPGFGDIIVTMKSALGKYLYLCLAGIILEAIVLIAVIIQTYRPISGLLQTIYDGLAGSAAVLVVFNFLTDWAEIFSGVIVCIILVVLYIYYREYRRSRALFRLYSWAKNASRLLEGFNQGNSGLQDVPLQQYDRAKALVDTLTGHCRGILADARTLGNELDTTARKAIYTLFTIEDKVEQHDDTAFEDMQTLIDNLSDVVTATVNSAKQTDNTDILSQESRMDTW